VILYRSGLVLFLLFSVFVTAYTQILDDTTKQVYGTRTTFYLKESDIVNLDSSRYSVDTSSQDLHRIPQVYGRNTFYQDLGVLGTPVNYYGYEMPDRPGRRFGFDVFDPFTFSINNIKYYDTKSPFSEVKYVQGSRGQQVIDLTYSRNINWHWNVGFDYRRFVSKKTIGQVRKINQSLGNSFDIYTRYFTARGRKYQVLAAFAYFDILHQETGGIRPLPEDKGQLDSLYDDIRELIFLNGTSTSNGPRSSDKRFDYRIYQELPLVKSNLIQVYDRFTFARRFTWMKENTSRRDSVYIDSLNLPFPGKYEQTSTFNNTVHHERENEAGIKGGYAGLVYRFYHRYRHLFYYHGYESARLRWVENFAGTHLHYSLKDSSRVVFEAEKMLSGPDLSVKAAYNRKLFQVGFNQLKYSPSLFELYWAGNYLQWNSTYENIGTIPRDPAELKPTSTTRFYGRLNLEKKSFFVRADIAYSTINNYIYLDAGASRRQASDDQKINLLDIKSALGLRLWHFHLENYNNFFNVSGADSLLRLPQFVNRTRFYFQDVVADAAYFQLGFDLNYRSSYFADKYLPFHRHYYLNNTTKLPEYLYGTVFVDVRLKNVTGFIMVENVTQGWLSGPGYFVTPGYTGLPRTLVFGIHWKFYN
jgi:hypothetical protein